MSQSQAERVITEFGARGWTLGTCESLTGGAVATALTGVPGSSAVFRGALVTYASDLKCALAGVDPGWVAEHGVVNETTARQMAAGARLALGVTWCLALTGVAGPSSQDGEQPGTVWLALAGPQGSQARRLALLGDRATIRRSCVAEGLDFVFHWACCGQAPRS